MFYRPYKPKRLKGKRTAKLASKSSSSSTSDDDSPDSVSPIPRVRSIEALEFLSQAKQQRMAAMMMMQQQQQQKGGNAVSKTFHNVQQQVQPQNPNHFASALGQPSTTLRNEWQNATTSGNASNNAQIQTCSPSRNRQVEICIL